MSAPIGVAVLQTAAQPHDWREALAAVEAEVAMLAALGADLVVIPEFAITGYNLDFDYVALAGHTAEPTIDALRRLARKHTVTLATAIPHLDANGDLRDASLVTTPDGGIHLGGKRYLWGDEHDRFEPAARSGLLVPTPVGLLGVVVCYEAGFPETVRELARAGAELIAVPAAFGHARLHIWRLLARARAVENGCIVAAAGLCGENAAGVRFAGHSTIADPTGRRLAELDELPGRALVRIERDAVARARLEVPYLADLERLERVTSL
ncbi:carbon-nitrogen hydrolase family protein [Nocardia sp. SYP-A9097]|uniref:carbon-nitrogen hydrolase family protein n=1 Tax=Nocardia sp. SYP-A9097 TaxID=2663237 RepID=UPI001891CEFD|nr:carbon-nitrogen hydrolase family protein [Nocardia sp. SYP-A9097]